MLYPQGFQSTLPRGERPFYSVSNHDLQLFQSTLPRGERPERAGRAFVYSVFQSTLPRGERQDQACPVLFLSDFNPRSREGSDMTDMIPFPSPSIFQSTLPRGERPWFSVLSYNQNNFNPRSREGSDGNVHHCIEMRSNFNPRSREGSDAKVNKAETQREKFQSTLPRGERPGLAMTLPGRTNFNPRSREGSDTMLTSQRCCSAISIHAPARGATASSGSMYFHSNISIHAPARGATGCPAQRWLPCSYFNPRSREGSDRKYYLFLLYRRFLLKQYSQISIFSNYTNIESPILI